MRDSTGRSLASALLDDEEVVSISRVEEVDDRYGGWIDAFPILFEAVWLAFARIALRRPKPVVPFEEAHRGFLRRPGYLVTTTRRLILTDEDEPHPRACSVLAVWPLSELEIEHLNAATIRITFQDASQISYVHARP